MRVIEHSDVSDLRRRGVFDENWVTYHGGLRHSRIWALTVARYVIRLEMRGHNTCQRIRVTWTKVHFGGERPWMHCPHCEVRVAKLYRGLEATIAAHVSEVRPMRVRGSAPKEGPSIRRANCG